jgi:aspartyl/asparaginyl-tRNA synthetase
MTDEFNRPTFLTHFPVEIKSFYMQKAEDDKRVTESVDLLVPGVGEVVGGSMRTWDYEELMAVYKREGITQAATVGTWISASTTLLPTEGTDLAKKGMWFIPFPP